MSDRPVGQHALLSDCRAAALVTRGGSVDWWCAPRFDGPAVFARLLDEEAGHFSVAPVDAVLDVTWAYRPQTLVLDTTYAGPSGELVVTDALALGEYEQGHDLGRTAPGVLLRRARCVRGTATVRVEFVPRPEWGLIHPRLRPQDGGLVAEGGAYGLVLSTDLDLRVEDASAIATVTLAAGEDLCFALAQGDSWAEPAASWSAAEIRRRLEDTEASWRSWSDLHQSYSGPLPDLVLHSGVVLQGLTYARSGAIVAAPTTSLPEGVGSGQTWDYRFTWVRDASMTMQGLYVAACPDEADRYFAFVAHAAATQLERGQDLQIMYGIGGERDLSERELDWLSGWRDSGPVRVGNGAWSQRQLDVYGALLDAAYLLKDQLGELDLPTRAFLGAAVEAAADRWADDDQGIWEVRGAARPFLHSRLMCWVAVDRGVRLAELGVLDDGSLDRWRGVRDEIRTEIETRGWSESAGAYSQVLGSDDLDAAALQLATTGFLPPDDDRLRRTIDAVEAGLADERGLLYRYRSPDGFDSDEGSFLLCTFWLAEALAVTGQVDRARATLERAAAYATELGLFAEQVESATGALLGNFPQAFSHLGLVNAAQALADAEARVRPG